MPGALPSTKCQGEQPQHRELQQGATPSPAFEQRHRLQPGERPPRPRSQGCQERTGAEADQREQHHAAAATDCVEGAAGTAAPQLHPHPKQGRPDGGLKRHRCDGPLRCAAEQDRREQKGQQQQQHDLGQHTTAIAMHKQSAIAGGEPKAGVKQ